MTRAVLIAALLAGCNAGSPAATTGSRPAGTAGAVAANNDLQVPRASADGPPSAGAGARDGAAAGATSPWAWRTAYDWDGDGVKDEVVTRFSGGAHCCYLVGVKLAAGSKTIMLPFKLDGGLVPPEDAEQAAGRRGAAEAIGVGVDVVAALAARVVGVHG